MKRMIVGVVSAVAIGLAVNSATAAESVNVGAPNWTSAKAMASLIKVLVEEKLGGTANLVPGTNATIFQGMDRGKGDIDVHPDVWLPNQVNFVDTYVKEKGTVALSQNPYDGRQGFCVDKKFAQEHNVSSIFDLARPEVAQMLDSDGNGKGEIWIGAPGWASANVNEVKVRDYGLLPFMDAVRTEQAVNLTRVGDMIKKNKPVAFYCYAPNEIWFMHDIVQLSEPQHDPAEYKMVQPAEDADWYNKAKVASEDAIRKVQIAYSKSLSGRAPAIAELLAKISLDTEVINQWSYEIAAKKRNPADVVREWIGENEKRVDGWLGL